jgi:hypothetical protein
MRGHQRGAPRATPIIKRAGDTALHVMERRVRASEGTSYSTYRYRCPHSRARSPGHPGPDDVGRVPTSQMRLPWWGDTDPLLGVG